MIFSNQKGASSISPAITEGFTDLPRLPRRPIILDFLAVSIGLSAITGGSDGSGAITAGGKGQVSGSFTIGSKVSLQGETANKCAWLYGCTPDYPAGQQRRHAPAG